MNVRDAIEEKETIYKELHGSYPSELQIDPYYIAELAKELGYGEADYLLDSSILETYRGYTIKVLEDGPDIIKFV